MLVIFHWEELERWLPRLLETKMHEMEYKYMADPVSSWLLISSLSLELFAPLPASPEAHTFKTIADPFMFLNLAIRISLLPLHCKFFSQGDCVITSKESSPGFVALLADSCSCERTLFSFYCITRLCKGHIYSLTIQ